jgi:excisionase family DNA binding protein
MDEAWMTYSYQEVADALGFKVTTLYQWVRQGRIEGPTYLGVSARFTLDQVNKIRTGGVMPPGTYLNPASPRALIGAKGAAVRAENQLKLKKRKTTRTKPGKVNGRKKKT